MPYPTYKIHTAPILEPGYGYRVRQLGAQYPGTFEIALGDQVEMDMGGHLFEIEPDDASYIVNPTITGPSRIGRLSPLPQRVNLTLKGDELSATEWQNLLRVLTTGRPVAVGAWFDKSTVWMSHFAGVDPVIGGIAEVGRCNPEQIQRRNAGDYWKHPVAGWNNLQSGLTDFNGNNIPKIVEGDVGRAIALEDSTYNILTQYTPASGTSLFPNQSASGSDVRTVASIYGPGFPQGWVDHILLQWITATDAYVETDDITFPDTTLVADTQAFTAVLLASGSGPFKMSAEGSGSTEEESFTLSDDIQAFPMYFGAAAASTHRIRLSADSGNCMMRAHALAVYPGRWEPSSFPTNTGDWDDPEVPDAVIIDDVVPAESFTVVTWVKYHNSEARKVLFSSTSLGQAFHWYVQAETLYFEIDDGSTHTLTDLLSAAGDGEWIQLAVSFGPSSVIDYTHEYKFYLNGIQVGTIFRDNQNPFALIAASPFGFTIGQTPHGQPWWSCAFPISRWRLDARVWTATEIAQDWTNWTDQGMKAFLGKVTGRYFLPEHTMSPNGPFIDRMNGLIRLRQVDVRVQSAT